MFITNKSQLELWQEMNSYHNLKQKSKEADENLFHERRKNQVLKLLESNVVLDQVCVRILGSGLQPNLNRTLSHVWRGERRHTMVLENVSSWSLKFNTRFFILKNKKKKQWSKEKPKTIDSFWTCCYKPRQTSGDRSRTFNFMQNW